MADRGIECREVSLSRRTPAGEQKLILDSICATFEAGSLSLVTGVIGSGKTTLLHLLSTILRPSSGEVLADGEAVSRYAPAHRDRWRRQAGLAFQSAHFLDELTVLENVMVPLVTVASSLAEAQQRALAELQRFQIEHLAARRLAGLSGGERQRITLARALVGRPRFVFADEPTAHQDEQGAEAIIARLAALAQQGATVVVVSHDPRLPASGAAQKSWTLDGGRLEAAS